MLAVSEDVVAITDSNFEENVIGSSEFWLIYFGASWVR